MAPFAGARRDFQHPPADSRGECPKLNDISPTSASTQARLRRILPSAVFVVVIDTTVMNVSISAVAEDLGTDVTGVQSAIALFALTVASSLLVASRVADAIGRMRAFRLGLGIYLFGTLLTAVAPNLAVLIIGWSFIEGLGTALVLPTAQALVRNHFEGEERLAMYARVASVIGLAAAIGPLLGGVVTTYLSWRIAFAGEGVVIIVALVAIQRLGQISSVGEGVELDFVGAGLTMGGLGGMVGALIALRPLGQAPAAGLLVLGICCLLGLTRWLQHREANGREPLMHRSIFRVKTFRLAAGVMMAFNFANGGFLLVVPVQLQYVLGADALGAGLVLAPMSLSLFVVSLGLPRWLPDLRPRLALMSGITLVALGCIGLIPGLEPARSAWALIGPLTLIGIGAGCIVSHVFNVILSSVPLERSTEAAGLASTGIQFAIAMGTASAGAVITTSLGGDIADQAAAVGGLFTPADQTRALQLGLAAPILVASIAALASRSLDPDAGLVDQEATSA